MSWMKRLFGGKDDPPPPQSPPPPEVPPAEPELVMEEDDAQLDQMIIAASAARFAFYGGLGEVHPDVVTHLINPSFMGGPRWPAFRQAWRVIRRPGSTLIASDGLTDPFDDDLTPMGYRVEVCAETEDAIDPSSARDNWVFGLVYQASQAVAASGSVYELIEEDGLVITAVFPVENAPEAMRGEDGGIGVIIGFPAADLPREIPTPDGAALLLVVKPLLPSELAYIETQEDGQAARRHLIDLLQQQPRPHFAMADRPPVI